MVIAGSVCLGHSLRSRADEKPANAVMSIEAVAAKARPSLVLVRSTDRTGGELGLGAGFVIDSQGLIATARHVIGDGRDIVIELEGGKLVPVTEVYASSAHLDLAIIRIDANGIIPLPISDEDDTAQGREVVALGHPRGFRNTIASGIVSGHQEFDGIRMLQLGMSIDHGNSGGPVLDRQGNVVGIVTMKSTVTKDVGFALPVKLLRDLKADPNPVPIARWRTIGTLDGRLWQPVFGANWRQRAGRITVNGQGTSFGGRTLCVQQAVLPEMPFDLQVIVKLKDEQGAAGLIFHSDGNEKHYGFYPSAGNLRLTRFSGPDVYSWTILHNEPHEAYKPGEWNTLTVRIHSDRFECFVNGSKVVESSDNALPPGKSGIASFRGTEAEFRRFETGENLLPSSLSPASREQLQQLANSVRPDAPAGQTAILQLVPFSESASDFLNAEALLLEQRAKQLRQLSRDTHDAATRTLIAECMAIKPESTEASSENSTDLLRAALLVAHMDNPDIDVDAYVGRVDEMAQELKSTFPEGVSDLQKLELLDKDLFEDLGFRGSRFEYYSRSNSYLNEVIDDREGLPITLSILYMELAKRVGLNVVGVGLPGHFVVRYEPADPAEVPVVIDPFEHGRRLSEAEIRQILANARFPNEPRFREAQTPVKILERMTTNLLALAERDRNDADVLRYLELLVMLAPESPEYRAKRLELRARTGRLTMAIDDADWFLENQSEAIDVERVRELRQSLEQQLERKNAGSR
jgi:regulator of sirC expression with transglutaminase-like and TPR domain